MRRHRVTFLYASYARTRLARIWWEYVADPRKEGPHRDNIRIVFEHGFEFGVGLAPSQMGLNADKR